MKAHWIALVIVACGGSTKDSSVVGQDQGDVAAPDLGNEGGVEAGLVEVAQEVQDLDVAQEATLPPRICKTGQGWTGGVAFKDVTLEAGLVGVAGTRLGAVDYDGDGRPDLSVRNYYPERDDFSLDKKRYTYLLHNDGGMHFSDRTRESKFTVRRDGGEGRVTHAVVFGDVDNDGDLDALALVNVDPDETKPDPGDRTEVLLNNGDGTFSLGPGGAIREADKRMPAFGAAFVDADRDGFLDVWVGYAQGKDQPEPDRLYRGDGTGSFVDVTLEAGLMTKPWLKMVDVQNGLVHRNTWGVLACDLNGDGWPELLSSVYGRYFNALWLGAGDGKFTDISMASGYAADDRTNWRTNLNAQCYCKLNPTAEDCPGTPEPPPYFPCKPGQQLRWDHQYDRQLWRLGGNTFTTACADMDNDGDMDLVNFEIVHWDVGETSDPTELLINDASPTPHFVRPGNEATGLVRTFDNHIDWNAGDMTGALFDFDNDGRTDILIASSDYPYTRAFLFHQKADGTFEEVTPDKGIAHPRAHGVAVADFDGDGDLDVALGHGLARCQGDSSCYPTHEVHLFRNEIGQDANSLRIALVGGPGSNRAAIGARVRVTAGGVTQTKDVGGGYGHFGIQHELVLTFGLGPVCDVEQVEVRWPDKARTTEVWKGIRANYTIRLRQGDPDVEYLTP